MRAAANSMLHSSTLFAFLFCVVVVMLPITIWTACFVIATTAILTYAAKRALEHKVELSFHEDHTPLVERWEFPKKPYNLSFWTWSANLNTFINANRPAIPIDYRRETILASDGAQLVLDWHGEHNDGPTIFILPGVSGHSNAGYLVPLVKQLSADGYCVAVHTHPGMNSTPVTNGRFTRCFDTEDTATIMSHVRSSRPKNSPLIALGYSLGGAMLVKYIGKHRHDTNKDGFDGMPLTAAIIASCPWDFPSVMARMDRGWTTTRLYNTYFASIYKDAMESVGTGGGFTEETLEEAKKRSTLRELDDLITRRVWGFDSVDDYYATVTCTEDLKSVEIPLLIIHALDDPLVPTSVVPRDIINKNKNIIYCETKKGGHVAWLSGLFPTRGLSWLDQTNVDVIEGFIEHLRPETSPRLRRKQRMPVRDDERKA